MAEQPNLTSEAQVLAGAASASVTGAMVEHIAALAERSATALDTLTDPDVLALLQQLRQSAPNLTRTLKRVDDLATSGVLDTLLELAEVVHIARLSMSDTTVERLGDSVRTLAEVADTLMTSGLPAAAPGLVAAVDAAREEAARNPESIGIFSLLRVLKEPQLQFGLKFMLALVRRLPAAGGETERR